MAVGWLVHKVECRWRCVEGRGGGEGREGGGGRGGKEGVLGPGCIGLDVVHRLPRGDLGQSLAGAPQLPRDLARAHLRRIEEEEEKQE